MSTFNWPGLGIKSISWSLDQPAQVNASPWSGKRTVVSDPWHGKWSARVDLASQQGDSAFLTARAFFTQLAGQVNTFHLPAVEQAQNGNTGVTLASNAAQGAASLSLTGVTTALVAGNMATIAGQLLSIISVGSLSGGAQTITFKPKLRAAATAGASVETAKPYALVALTDSSFTWDIGMWRRYGLSFSVDEAVGETDGADPLLDIWTGGVGGGGGGGGSSFSFPQLPSFTSRALLAAVVSPVDKQLAYLTEAGREGDFVFSTANLSAKVTADSSNQGIYVPPLSDTTGASGAWVRKFDAALNVKWFGAVADGTTDDSAAFVAALAYVKATGNAWQAHGYAGPGAAKLFIPKGIYNLGSTTLDITCGLIIEGEGGSLNGPGSSVLTWTSNVTGIRVQAFNTSGASTTGLSNAYSGDGVLLRNFSMDGAFAGTESEAHGIHIRGHAQVENVFIDRFAGDGIHIAADASGNNGNANNWLVVNCQVQRCRNGLYVAGPDSNAGHSIGFCANANRRWGLLDSSFLGDAHYAPHAAQNGFVGYGDGTTIPVTLVHYSGRLFTPVHGQEATASVTTPPASKSDSAYWLYYTDGVAGTGIPTWTSGVLLRSGGSYCGDQSAATGEFNNPYSESDSILAQVFGSWRITGGIQGSGNPAGNGQYHYAGNNEYNVGYLRGAAADYSWNIGHTNFAYLNFYSYTVAGTTRVLTGGLRAFTGGYMAALFTTEWDYVRNGVTIAYWDAGGLNLQSGYKLSVNGTQVVTARQTGTAAVATDLATAITLVNDLRAKLITHGLIS